MNNEQLFPFLRMRPGVAGKEGMMTCQLNHERDSLLFRRSDRPTTRMLSTGKMNKLLSLLLLALAVVSTQGFAVSSGIPVLGGAVGGTWLFS